MRRIFPNLLIFAAAVGIGVTAVWLVGGFETEIPIDISQVEIIQAIPDTAKDDTSELFFSKISAEDVTDTKFFEFVVDGEVVFDDCSHIFDNSSDMLALIKRGEEFSLERVKLEHKKPVKSNFGNYATAEFKDSKDALMIVEGSETLKPGPVKTAYLIPEQYDYSPEPVFMSIGYRKEIKIGDRVWTLRVARGIKNDDRKNVPMLVLVVESESDKQIIWYRSLSEGISDNAGWLEWAGDMDGDGLLDLQQSFYETNDGTQTSILYLSSLAKNGEFVRPYAFFSNRTFDCENK